MSSQELCNSKNCEMMPTSLECMFWLKIPEVKPFHLKGKARLSWNIAALQFLAKLAENNCEGDHFLVEFFSKIC